MTRARPVRILLSRCVFVALALGAIAASSAHAENMAFAGADYASHCKQQGVPLPPPWGGPSMKWVARGVSTDPYFGEPGLEADVYYYQSTSAPTGLCVMAAHKNSLFDIICQGTNGKACFWEGNQSRIPPAAPVVLADPNGGAQNFVKGGAALSGEACTKCHAGQNVFINHYSATSAGGGTHPLNLRGFTGYVSPTWYDPIVNLGWRLNPGPETFPGYPAATSPCANNNCHGNANAGGKFPALSFELVSNYCQLVAAVANRPGQNYGMGTLTCTPGTDCPLQTDPFVRAMIDVGCQQPPSAQWGFNQIVRINSGSWLPPGKPTWPAGAAFVFDAWPQVKSPSIRWSPSVYNWTSNGLTIEHVYFPVGPYGLAGRVSNWQKGASMTQVAGVWNGTNRQFDIWEYGASGPLTNLTANVPIHPAEGVPFGHRRYNGRTVVIYRGTDEGLHGLYTTSTSTYTYEAFPANPAGAPADGLYKSASEPMAFKRSTRGDSVLFRPVGCSNCVGEYRIADGTYYRSTLYVPTAIAFGTIPRGLRDVNGVATIFVSTDQAVFAYTSTGATESAFSYAGKTIVGKKSATSPMPFYDHLGRLAVVWTENPNNGSAYAMHLATYDNGTWTDMNLPSRVNQTAEPEAPVGDPAPYVTANGHIAILYMTMSNTLYKYEYNPTYPGLWSREVLYKP